MKRIMQSSVLVISILAIMMSGCFTILEITQPSSATPGEKITVKLFVRHEGDPTWGPTADTQWGILGLMIPEDWVIDSVTYRSHDVPPDTSNVGPGSMAFLDPDVPDNSPADPLDPDAVDFWTDSLEVRYPPPAGMLWEVWQSVTPDSTTLDTGYVDVFVHMTVGQTEGNFDLGYFITLGSLNFTIDYYFAYSPGNTITVTTTAIDNIVQKVPGKFALAQNYPNPFNPSTTIRYNLATKGDVYLSVFDIAGKEVAVLVNGQQSAGEHQVTFSAEDLSSGVYLYRLSTGDQTLIKKMMLVK